MFQKWRPFVKNLPYKKCHKRLFLPADVGGGTTDLIVFEKLDRNFREVVCGSGDLCGGTFVDKAFHDWLGNHIGPCFDAYEKQDPCQALLLATWWDTQKRAFTGAGYPLRLDLPMRLVQLWMEQDKQQIKKPVGVIRWVATNVGNRFWAALVRARES